ncbi:hypothetical protein ACTND3_09230 [Bacillota bacterium HCP28S3_F12]
MVFLRHIAVEEMEAWLLGDEQAILAAYGKIGKIKSEWAVNIGRHMDWDNNKSPSFQFFVSEINRRVV